MNVDLLLVEKCIHFSVILIRSMTKHLHFRTNGIAS